MRNPFEIVQNELEKKEEKRAPKHTEEFFDREKIKGEREKIRKEKGEIFEDKNLPKELKELEEQVKEALSLRRRVSWPGAKESMEEVVKHLDEGVETCKGLISSREARKKERE